MNLPIQKYLFKFAHTLQFSRKILTDSTRTLFNRIPDRSSYRDINLDEACVVHIRGGDALFEGLRELPSLAYYAKSIKSISPKYVIIVSEPSQIDKYKLENPVTKELLKFCESIGIESRHISSEDVYYDAGVIFHAKRIVSSN